MVRTKKDNKNSDELLKFILFHYLEKGKIEEKELIKKYDNNNELISVTEKHKVSDLPIQDLLKIYEMINTLNKDNIDEIILGIKK
jgi:hypothetical protein